MWTALLALLFFGAPQTDTTETYYVAFLRPAPDRKALPKAEMDRIQSAHMANIHDMAAKGTLVSAGPFDDKPLTISGIFILKAKSLERAAVLAAEDPTVVEHRNTVDTHVWAGPKGIGAEYTRLHREHPETPENMGQHPLFLIYAGAQPHPRKRFEMRDSSKLGAFGVISNDTDDLKAIVIFERIPAAEAQRRMDAEPAIQSGAFRAEAHTWWSADHVLPAHDSAVVRVER